MPQVKFIGNYDVLSQGKYLFEILAQLKDFGRNRIVTKHEWLRRWPNQPSYLVIKKVEPQMDRWLRKGKVYGDWIFRGKNLGVYEFSRDLDRSEWRLIAKDDEEVFTKSASAMRPLEFPGQIPFPPLLRYMNQRNLSKDDTKMSSNQMLSTQRYIDEEHEIMQPFMKNVNNKMSPSSSVYDVDRETYLEVYGKELPVRVEKWGD